MKPLLLQCHSNDEYAAMIADHRDRHQAYADRHGYDYEVFDMTAAGVPYDNGFARLQVPLDRIREGKWSHVFWLDADCIVLDLRRDMRETLPGYASYAFTVHPYPIATYRANRWHWQVGQMYFRCDTDASDFLGNCLAKRHLFANDQHAVNSQLMAYPDYQQSLCTIYQSWNNTLHDEQSDGTIVAAFHGYGRDLAERRAAMQQLAAQYPYTHEGYMKLANERLGVERANKYPMDWPDDATEIARREGL